MKRIWSDCRKCHKFAIQSKLAIIVKNMMKNETKWTTEKVLLPLKVREWMRTWARLRWGRGVGSGWVEAGGSCGGVGVAWRPNLAFEQWTRKWLSQYKRQPHKRLQTSLHEKVKTFSNFIEEGNFLHPPLPPAAATASLPLKFNCICGFGRTELRTDTHTHRHTHVRYVHYTHLKCPQERGLIETISKVCHNIIRQCFSWGALDAHTRTIHIQMHMRAHVCVVNLWTTMPAITEIILEESETESSPWNAFNTKWQQHLIGNV